MRTDAYGRFYNRWLAQFVRIAVKTPGKMSELILLGLFSQSVAQADTWRNDDTTREVIYLTLHVFDWGETRDIVQRDDIFLLWSVITHNSD